MVGTVRAARHRGRARAAFTAGLALGAAAIFVALGALGSLISGRAVVVAAVALGVAAVASDALGLRVRPQIHFQVPEPLAPDDAATARALPLRAAARNRPDDLRARDRRLGAARAEPRARRREGLARDRGGFAAGRALPVLRPDQRRGAATRCSPSSAAPTAGSPRSGASTTGGRGSGTPHLASQSSVVVSGDRAARHQRGQRRASRSSRVTRRRARARSGASPTRRQRTRRASRLTASSPTC